MLDMLSRAGGLFQGVRYPELDFEVNCFFAVGCSLLSP